MEIQKHHVKSEPCSTRPKYRDGKIPRSVKVYSVVNESKYLLVSGVPVLNVVSELIKLFSIYGVVEDHKVLHEYPSDEFHEVVLIKFLKIQNARCAKIKLDKYNFYGSSLSICYVPEYENEIDLREKLNERRAIVEIKCAKYEAIGLSSLNTMKPAQKKSHKMKNHFKNGDHNQHKCTQMEESKTKMVMYPQLPENWKKETYTGDESYDITVNEIEKKLKRTQPICHPIQKSKKRKKILQV